MEPNSIKQDKPHKSLSLAVVVCTYDLNRYSQLKEAIDSLLDQSYKFDEIVIVASGGLDLGNKISHDYGHHKTIKVIPQEGKLGISEGRNVGIKNTAADIIAFTDDDVIVDKQWVENLMKTYEQTDAIAVGGSVMPIWLVIKPDYLPEELYWLIAATDTAIYNAKLTEFRSTFGPNMSFRREVFEHIGGFNGQLGFSNSGNTLIQGEECEFGLRMKSHFDKGIIYNPHAKVYHKVPPSKLKLKMLIKRSFYQGYSKYLIRTLTKTQQPLRPERNYLITIFGKYIPNHIKNIFTGERRLSEFKKLLILLICVFSVGLGFVYGRIKHITKPT